MSYVQEWVKTRLQTHSMFYRKNLRELDWSDDRLAAKAAQREELALSLQQTILGLLDLNQDTYTQLTLINIQPP